MTRRSADMREDAAAAMAAAPVPDVPASVAEVQDGESGTADEASATVVVCAFPGTEEMMGRIWTKMCPDVSVKVMPVRENKPQTELLAELVADNGIADRFILIPANCVPCAPVSFEELHVPFVFMDVRGGLHYSHRLPVPVRKDVLVDVLGSDADDAEDVMKRYILAIGRPVVAAFREGNIVTPVLRGAPCENVVLEAILRKKYIVANQVGFSAIRTLLMKTLLK